MYLCPWNVQEAQPQVFSIYFKHPRGSETAVSSSRLAWGAHICLSTCLQRPSSLHSKSKRETDKKYTGRRVYLTRSLGNRRKRGTPSGKGWQHLACHSGISKSLASQHFKRIATHVALKYHYNAHLGHIHVVPKSSDWLIKTSYVAIPDIEDDLSHRGIIHPA